MNPTSPIEQKNDNQTLGEVDNFGQSIQVSEDKKPSAKIGFWLVWFLLLILISVPLLARWGKTEILKIRESREDLAEFNSYNNYTPSEKLVVPAYKIYCSSPSGISTGVLAKETFKKTNSEFLNEELSNIDLKSLANNLENKFYNDSQLPTAIYYTGFNLAKAGKFEDAFAFYECAAGKYYDISSMYRVAQVYKHGTAEFKKSIPSIIVNKEIKPDLARAYFWIAALIHTETIIKTGVLDVETQVGWNIIAILDSLQQDESLSAEDLSAIEQEAVAFVGKKYPEVLKNTPSVFNHSMRAVSSALGKPSSNTPSSKTSIDDFSMCLKDSGAAFYGNGNADTIAQTALFGISSYNLPFASCTTDETDVTKSKFDFCIYEDNRDVKYPVWVFPDGTQFDSSIETENLFDLLSQKTKCLLPEPNIVSVSRIPIIQDTSSIFVSGQYAYTVSYGPDHNEGGSLQVFNGLTQGHPVLLRTTLLERTPTSIHVSENYAYIVDATDGILEIFDVSVPSKPMRVGELSTFPYPRSVVVRGRYAYVTSVGEDTGEGFLQIIDIQNKDNPLVISQITTDEFPAKVVVDEHYAYVLNYLSKNLQIFDISIPDDPSLVSTTYIGKGAVSLALSDKYLYVTTTGPQGQILVFNVSNPSKLREIKLGYTPKSPQSLFFSNDRVYSVDYSSKILQIFDATEFEDIRYKYGIAGIVTYGHPSNIFVSKGYAYVTSDQDKNDWLEIFKVP